MEFEWDEKKNILNVEKHGIDFNDAYEIFNNPTFIKVDNRKNYQEKRWIGLGKLKNIIVVIAYTKRKNKVRIISIRKANKKERQIYNERINQN